LQGVSRERPFDRLLRSAALEGDARVRYVYVDEAGTAANQPISVVVAIIVHADTQCAEADARVRRILESVPVPFKQKHPIFHAKSIWGERAFRDLWNLQQRLKVLRAMMSIPRKMNMAIALGTRRRSTFIDDAVRAMYPSNLSLSQLDHGMAFTCCIAKADSWIRQYAEHNEVATAIAEDMLDIKSFLRQLAKGLQRKGFKIPAHSLQVGDSFTREELGVFKVSRIRLPIYFALKQEEALLQIADACAFGFRRFLSHQPRDDFVRSIIGRIPKVKWWEESWDSASTFHWPPPVNVHARFGSLASSMFLNARLNAS
jgi:hypothetical protein